MFQPDRLEFKSEGALVWLISAIHLVAIVAVLLSNLPAPLYAILLLPLLISWMLLLRRYGWLSHGECPVYLRWDQNGWYTALRAEPDREVRVQPDDGCRLWPGWNLLSFRSVDSPPGLHFVQLVRSGTDNRRAIRRLRVLLRLRGSSHS